MSLTTVCQILLGSLLVVLGMIGSALADRIRGIVRGHLPTLAVAQTVPSLPRERTPRTRSIAPISAPSPATSIPGAGAPQVLPVVKPKAKSPDEIMAQDVAAALVAAGYTKRVAEEAVRACVCDERATIETWTKAALRRCNLRVSA